MDYVVCEKHVGQLQMIDSKVDSNLLFNIR